MKQAFFCLFPPATKKIQLIRSLHLKSVHLTLAHRWVGTSNEAEPAGVRWLHMQQAFPKYSLRWITAWPLSRMNHCMTSGWNECLCGLKWIVYIYIYITICRTRRNNTLKTRFYYSNSKKKTRAHWSQNTSTKQTTASTTWSVLQWRRYILINVKTGCGEWPFGSRNWRLVPCGPNMLDSLD